jgi:Immunoglobulin-like domain of bacterial spore germination
MDLRKDRDRRAGWQALPLLLATLLLLVVGCAAGGSGDAPRAEESTGPASTGETRSTVPDTTAADRPETTSLEGDGEETARAEPEAAEGPFGDDPRASGGAGGGADGILDVRFGVHEGYERVVVDLGEGSGRAAAVPEWTLESPEGDGLLRVSIPSAEATAVSDGELGGELLERYYVVRAPDGGMFVDFFAREAFVYRVVELSDPARLAVDFKPTGYPLAVPLPARGGNTVLVRPRDGERVGDPFTISGYSRTFEASNSISLLGPSGEVLAQKTATGNDWSETWGYFETKLDRPPALANGGTLQVGTYSARDGSFEGVEIEVF